MQRITITLDERLVGEFEKRFAELIGTSEAVAVSSGTDAVALALAVVVEEQDRLLADHLRALQELLEVQHDLGAGRVEDRDQHRREGRPAAGDSTDSPGAGQCDGWSATWSSIQHRTASSSRSSSESSRVNSAR